MACFQANMGAAAPLSSVSLTEERNRHGQFSRIQPPGELLYCPPAKLQLRKPDWTDLRVELRKERSYLDSSLRGPLVLVEVVALGAILAMVENTVVRVLLGLTVALLLARAAIAEPGPPNGPPTGLPERRQDHLFRHWLNTLIKKAREFHTVCQGVKDEKVNLAVGQLKIQQIEQELQKLLTQMADTVKPTQIKRTQARRPQSGPSVTYPKRPADAGGTYDTHVEDYGDKFPPD